MSCKVYVEKTIIVIAETPAMKMLSDCAGNGCVLEQFCEYLESTKALICRICERVEEILGWVLLLSGLLLSPCRPREQGHAWHAAP